MTWLDLFNKLGILVVEVIDHKAFNASTRIAIPSEHMFDLSNVDDGLYTASEHTCGNAVISPSGKRLGSQAPQHLKDKFQCRIGRHAPKCNMYAPNKCAKYSVTAIGKSHISIDGGQLINAINVE